MRDSNQIKETILYPYLDINGVKCYSPNQSVGVVTNQVRRYTNALKCKELTNEEFKTTVKNRPRIFAKIQITDKRRRIKV